MPLRLANAAQYSVSGHIPKHHELLQLYKFQLDMAAEVTGRKHMGSHFQGALGAVPVIGVSGGA
jgi:hypothetical protein